MIDRGWPATLAGLLCLTTAGLSTAQTTPIQNQGDPLFYRDSKDAAIFRGGVVYASYCVTCHGINADGNGRAARLYNPRPANLRTTDKNDSYIEMIVRKGGEAIGRSPKMPPWGEELTNEQIRDVVTFIRSINGK